MGPVMMRWTFIIVCSTVAMARFLGGVGRPVRPDSVPGRRARLELVSAGPVTPIRANLTPALDGSKDT